MAENENETQDRGNYVRRKFIIVIVYTVPVWRQVRIPPPSPCDS
jgi:hypothetical protein